jgi:hypothetical protein
MAAFIPVEQESGTSRVRIHPHNGYYAGDFSTRWITFHTTIRTSTQAPRKDAR